MASLLMLEGETARSFRGFVWRGSAWFESQISPVIGLLLASLARTGPVEAWCCPCRAGQLCQLTTHAAGGLGWIGQPGDPRAPQGACALSPPAWQWNPVRRLLPGVSQFWGDRHSWCLFRGCKVVFPLAKSSLLPHPQFCSWEKGRFDRAKGRARGEGIRSWEEAPEPQATSRQPSDR